MHNRHGRNLLALAALIASPLPSESEMPFVLELLRVRLGVDDRPGYEPLTRDGLARLTDDGLAAALWWRDTVGSPGGRPKLAIDSVELTLRLAATICTLQDRSGVGGQAAVCWAALLSGARHMLESAQGDPRALKHSSDALSRIRAVLPHDADPDAIIHEVLGTDHAATRATWVEAFESIQGNAGYVDCSAGRWADVFGYSEAVRGLKIPNAAVVRAQFEGVLAESALTDADKESQRTLHTADIGHFLAEPHSVSRWMTTTASRVSSSTQHPFAPEDVARRVGAGPIVDVSERYCTLAKNPPAALPRPGARSRQW